MKMDLTKSKVSVYAIPGITMQTKADIIINAVCEAWNISEEKLKRKTRLREVVEPRQAAMLLMCRNTKLTTSEIGLVLGGLDHATVIYGRRNAELLKQMNIEYSDKFENALNIIS
jgi:chromosomal replication initiator protein